MRTIFIIGLILINQTSFAADDVKLSPRMRAETLDASYSIKSKYIMPHLEHVVILEELGNPEDLPYVVSHGEDRISGAPGDKVLVRGITSDLSTSNYTFLAVGKSYKHPNTGEPLGTAAYVIGEGSLESRDNVSVMEITESSEGIEYGDKVIPRIALNLPETINIKRTEATIEGSIISVIHNIVHSGKNRVIVVGLGERDGLSVGNLFEVFSKDRIIKDENAVYAKNGMVTLHGLKSAEVLIYKIYSKVSLGVVLTSSSPITVGDKIKSVSRI